jgi:hypothetical protein
VPAGVAARSANAHNGDPCDLRKFGTIEDANSEQQGWVVETFMRRQEDEPHASS